MGNYLEDYQSVVTEIKDIILSGRKTAYNAANKAMILTYWNVGRRIVEQEQAGKERAEYGKRLMAVLSDELTREFGSGFSEKT